MKSQNKIVSKFTLFLLSCVVVFSVALIMMSIAFAEQTNLESSEDNNLNLNVVDVQKDVDSETQEAVKNETVINAVEESQQQESVAKESEVANSAPSESVVSNDLIETKIGETGLSLWGSRVAIKGERESNGDYDIVKDEDFYDIYVFTSGWKITGTAVDGPEMFYLCDTDDEQETISVELGEINAPNLALECRANVSSTIKLTEGATSTFCELTNAYSGGNIEIVGPGSLTLTGNRYGYGLSSIAADIIIDNANIYSHVEDTDGSGALTNMNGDVVIKNGSKVQAVCDAPECYSVMVYVAEFSNNSLKSDNESSGKLEISKDSELYASGTYAALLLPENTTFDPTGWGVSDTVVPYSDKETANWTQAYLSDTLLWEVLPVKVATTVEGSADSLARTIYYNGGSQPIPPEPTPTPTPVPGSDVVVAGNVPAQTGDVNANDIAMLAILAILSFCIAYIVYPKKKIIILY